VTKSYTVSIRLRPENVFPDVFDWLEQQGILYGEHWNWERVFDDRAADAKFGFIQPEHATLFALRWA